MRDCPAHGMSLKSAGLSGVADAERGGGATRQVRPGVSGYQDFTTGSTSLANSFRLRSAIS